MFLEIVDGLGITVAIKEGHEFNIWSLEPKALEWSHGYSVQIVIPAADGWEYGEVLFLDEDRPIFTLAFAAKLGASIGGESIVAWLEVTVQLNVEDREVIGEHAAKLNLFFQFI